jgi:8-oxo-dGTP diphosphatase
MSIPTGIKKAAVLCILESPSGYLLLRRNKEPHFGKYIPVGGRLEAFETPIQAAKREVWEETQISVDSFKLIGMLTETSPTSFNWISYIYSAQIPTIQPVQCNEGTLEWISLDRLAEVPAPATDTFIYEHVAKCQFFIFDAVYDETLNLESLIDEVTNRTLLQL